jgi:peptide/nickel transport system permease protein
MSSSPTTPTVAPGALARLLDSDIWFSFRTSPMAILAAVIAMLCTICAVFAPWISPHNPFDLATLNLSDARLPPAWQEGGSTTYLLGTDDQGRDILSALFYGARISLFVGFAAVLVSMIVGVGLGLLSGFAGGWVDAFIMRVCDVMLSFPVHLDGPADRRRGPRAVSGRA